MLRALVCPVPGNQLEKPPPLCAVLDAAEAVAGGAEEADAVGEPDALAEDQSEG